MQICNTKFSPCIYNNYIYPILILAYNCIEQSQIKDTNYPAFIYVFRNRENAILVIDDFI